MRQRPQHDAALRKLRTAKALIEEAIATNALFDLIVEDRDEDARGRAIGALHLISDAITTQNSFCEPGRIVTCKSRRKRK